MFEVFLLYGIIWQGIGSIFCTKLVNFADREKINCIAVLNLETW